MESDLSGVTITWIVTHLNAAAASVALYVFAYPLVMSLVWMAGACLFFVRHERSHARGLETEALVEQVWPTVSVLLPCFNEGENVDEVVGYLMRLDYHDYEVIAINDGSTDDTAERLDRLVDRYPRLRVVHQQSNQGKAVGLNTATRVARGDILVGIDGDAVLDPGALRHLVRPFTREPRLGAVTGNPRIRTRSTVLGRLQVAEFSSIVGLIKRAQQVIFGRLYTVSGVVAAFRRGAVESVGGWSHDMLTEDIDISWRLQLAGWRIRFEPAALVWILMPETLHGLWKQRLRWATGGCQVAARFGPAILSNTRSRRMWPVLLEYLASLIWAWLMALTMLAAAVTLVADLSLRIIEGRLDLTGLQNVVLLLPDWTGLAIAVTCLLQFLLSLWMDSRYDVRLARVLGTMIWYPVVYWMINMATAICSVPRCMSRSAGSRAVWISPDRGLRPGGGTA